MQTQLIQIGNSKGVRLPKAILEQAGLTGPVTLSVTERGILLSPEHAARQGWAEAARSAAAEEAGAAVPDPAWTAPATFTDEDWTW
ncbi:MAG: AbrB/MazE/SpoVT family DNA-binding domain-containing protein [Desulfovibrionaceae bacterium]